MDNIEKLIVEVTPEDINHVVEQLRKQYTKWNVVDRAAQEKDRVVIDYYAIFEGKSDDRKQNSKFPAGIG